MAKARETIRERNAYFMDKYWISLGNSTLQHDFLLRFAKKFRKRIYNQIDRRFIGCGTCYAGDEISQFLQCDFAFFFEMYQKKCEELKALCDAYAECFARLGIMSCDKPYVTFIKPVIFATNRKDLLVLCHYSNIQPMFKQLNHFKKLFWCAEDNAKWKETVCLNAEHQGIFLTSHMLKLLGLSLNSND